MARMRHANFVKDDLGIGVFRKETGKVIGRRRLLERSESNCQ